MNDDVDWDSDTSFYEEAMRVNGELRNSLAKLVKTHRRLQRALLILMAVLALDIVLTIGRLVSS